MSTDRGAPTLLLSGWVAASLPSAAAELPAASAPRELKSSVLGTSNDGALSSWAGCLFSDFANRFGVKEEPLGSLSINVHEGQQGHKAQALSPARLPPR